MKRWMSILAVLVTMASGVTAAGAAPARGLVAPGQSRPLDGVPDPEDFVSQIDNPYYPLVPGTNRIYAGSRDNKNAIEIFSVTGETKVILGVRCHVIHDRLFLNESLAEDTIDWFAQDREGNVWYFGEATKLLDPSGHVISTKGSFQWGVHGAQGGIFMPGEPKVGATYRQEFYKGQAEDHFQILSLSADVKVPAGTFRDTMLTKEWTPLEPTVLSHKNFARGMGTVLELDVRGSNEHLELVAVLP